MFEFVAEIFGIGFEGMLATIVITIFPIALAFSTISWFVLRRWGSLRQPVETKVG